MGLQSLNSLSFNQAKHLLLPTLIWFTATLISALNTLFITVSKNKPLLTRFPLKALVKSGLSRALSTRFDADKQAEAPLIWELKYLCVLNLNTLSNVRRFCV